MKKSIFFLVFTFLLTASSSTNVALAQPTVHYNGGSGPIIEITYTSSGITIVPKPGDHLKKFRIDWILPGGGMYSQPMYSGVPLYLQSYDFIISSEWHSFPPNGVDTHTSVCYFSIY
ncbi:hypothetical protein [Albibacterium profundi]|uniref:Uncharacterized protein n=1 Tax=Albibacterium profundi TaxID=3134906 RepID=A0ABV5CK85_9SPHI